METGNTGCCDADTGANSRGPDSLVGSISRAGCKFDVGKCS